MSIQTGSVIAKKVLELATVLSPDDQNWLAEQLNRLLDDEPLPESATIDEAIELYLADECSLGRAAELAGVTRWDLQEILYERGTPVEIYNSKSVEEMDELADRLESRGILCCS